MLDLVGWIGGICLALCAIPQAVFTWRTKDASGLSWLFLILWGTGEVALFIYIFPNRDWPLLLNYFVNLVCIYTIVRVKLFD